MDRFLKRIKARITKGGAGPVAGDKAEAVIAEWRGSELDEECLTAAECATRLNGDSARGLRIATPTKQKGQHKPRQKSADVRHVGDATHLRCVGNGTDAAKKLQNDPEPNDNQRGHLNHSLRLQYLIFACGNSKM